jgi:hypothetical protein
LILLIQPSLSVCRENKKSLRSPEYFYLGSPRFLENCSSTRLISEKGGVLQVDVIYFPSQVEEMKISSDEKSRKSVIAVQMGTLLDLAIKQATGSTDNQQASSSENEETADLKKKDIPPPENLVILKSKNITLGKARSVLTISVNYKTKGKKDEKLTSDRF